MDGVKEVTFLNPVFFNKVLMERSGNVVCDHEDFWTDEEMVFCGSDYW